MFNTIKRVLPILVLAASAAVSLHAQEIAAVDYLPLKMGNLWHYIDTAAGNTEFDLKIGEQLSADGATAFKNQKSGSEDWDVLSNDAKGLRLHARKDKNGVINWKPAVVFVAARSKVGDVVTSTPDYTNPATGNKLLWTCKFEKLVDVAVPAGTFTQCAQIKITVQDSVLGTRLANFDMYLGKGVGVVKRQGQFFGVFFAQLLTKKSL